MSTLTMPGVDSMFSGDISSFMDSNRNRIRDVFINLKNVLAQTAKTEIWAPYRGKGLLRVDADNVRGGNHVQRRHLVHFFGFQPQSHPEKRHLLKTHSSSNGQN
jgi:hypothetical protein